jgi:hypothetical protein
MHDDSDRDAVRRIVETAVAPPSTARWRQVAAGDAGLERNPWLRGLRLKLGAVALVTASVGVVSIGLAGHHSASSPQASAGRPPAVAPPVVFVTAPAPALTVSPTPAAVPSVAPTSTVANALHTPTPQTPAGTPPPTPTTSALPSPAFPNAPYVKLDGHGGVLISGSGDNYWGIAYSTSTIADPSRYASPAIPASSSTFDYTPPAGYPRCISVEAIRGGNGYEGGTTGAWSRPIVCV